MVEMSLEEAQLFRILGGFFGRDRVVWNMSVRAVCGGSFPEALGEADEDIARWANIAGCLFTIVDADDAPKMVVELSTDLSRCIDVQQLDRQQRLPKLLDLCGVRYVLVSSSEFKEILDPNSPLDLVSLLKDRLGLTADGDGDDGEAEL